MRILFAYIKLIISAHLLLLVGFFSPQRVRINSLGYRKISIVLLLNVPWSLSCREYVL